METKAKKIKKFFKKFFKIFLVVSLIFSIISALLLLPFVQTFLAKKASNILSKKLNTTVKLEKIHINPFNVSVKLSGLYIEDENKDTLLYVGDLYTKLQRANFINNRYKIAKVEIDSVKACLKNINDTLSFAFMLPSKDTLKLDSLDNKKSNFEITVEDINLKNTDFVYTLGKKSSSKQMDYSDLRFSNINLLANEFFINQDIEIALNIDTLKLKEQCGLNLKYLKSSIFYSDYLIFLKNFGIKLNRSLIEGDEISLHYSGTEDLREFCDSVKIIAQLQDCFVDTRDIEFFTDALKDYPLKLKLNADVDGKVNNLDINKLNITFGENSGLDLDAKIKNLTDINKTYFDVNVNKLYTIVQDLPLDLPEALSDLGEISFESKIKGGLKDLFLDGALISNLGNIKTDVNLKLQDNKTSIKGLISANKLDLGAVAGDKKTFQTLNTHDTINVEIFSNGKISGLIAGSLDSLGLLGYKYDKISLKGDFSEHHFQGNIFCHDKNLDFDFNGLVNFDKKMPNFNFNFDLPLADLKALNILEDSIDKVSLSLTADFHGYNLDNLNGMVILTEPLVFEQNSKTFELKHFSINSYIHQYYGGLPAKMIKLRSDYVDADMKGLFQTDQLLKILANFAYMVMPSLNYEKYQEIRKQSRKTAVQSIRHSYLDPDFLKRLGNNFSYNLVLKNTDELTSFFYPNLNISNHTSLEGGFSTRQRHIYSKFVSQYIKYNDIILDSLCISFDAQKRDTKLNLSCDSIILSDQIKIRKPNFDVFAKNDTANFVFSWNNNQEDLPNYGKIVGDFILQKHEIENHFPLMLCNMHKNTFYINGQTFDYNDFFVKIDSSSVAINDFIIKTGNQNIACNGKISENSAEPLYVDFNKFDLSFLNYIISDANFSGIFDSKSKITNIYGQLPIFETENFIQDLKYNGVALGNVTAKANFTPKDSIVNLELYTQKKNAKDNDKQISGLGSFNLNNQTMDMSLNINYLQLKTFAPFFENYLEVSKYCILRGYARLKGKIDDPVILSSMSLYGGNLKINYLGTQYDINDSLGITLNNNNIQLHRTKIYSDRGSGLAYIEGKISHDNFSHFDVNLNLQTKNFMFLNKPANDTAAFYGKCYASGNIVLSGDPMRMINIDAKVKTDKNTLVYLPLYSTSEITDDNDFLTFVNYDDTLNLKNSRKANLAGLKMNFNLQVTPDAEVQIILDEATGNIMKAAASGNLQMNIDGSGDFQMYGTLTMEKGEYLFTMKNLISKKFEVEKGGTLRWNGDATEADVNLSAVYKLRKVNLYNLMLSDDYRDKKVPVSCILQMKENLLNPDIKFNMKVEESDDRVQTQIQNLDEANINKQVLSLLLLNQFQPLPGLKGNDQNSMFSDINPGEVVSNQLNHWLSDISDNFDVGVNYQMGDGATSNEFEVALSTQLFDDRVSINTNFGVGGEVKTQATTQNSSNVVGEVEVDVKLNKTGTIQLKAYNKANDDDFEENPYTQGVGLMFKKEFYRFNQIFRRREKIIKLQKEKNK